MVVARVAGAQNADPHRWAVAIAADGAGVASEFASRCAPGNAPGLGVGVAALFRPQSWLLVDADTRIMVAFPSDCIGFPRPAVPVGPNTTEQFIWHRYSPASPNTPLRRSAIHLGVETPADLPLARITLGGGALWSRSPSPLASVAFGVGSRGNGVRFYSEVEHDVSRVRVSDDYDRRTEASPGVVSVERVTRSVVHHPAWNTFHVGIEVPLRAR